MGRYHGNADFVPFRQPHELKAPEDCDWRRTCGKNHSQRSSFFTFLGLLQALTNTCERISGARRGVNSNK